MKNIQYYLLSIPVIYSAIMIINKPSISDAIIVASLCGVVGFMGYLKAKYDTITDTSQLSKLEEEMKIERLKIGLDQLKENAIRDNILRDARNAAMGHVEGKQIKF